MSNHTSGGFEFDPDERGYRVEEIDLGEGGNPLAEQDSGKVQSDIRMGALPPGESLAPPPGMRPTGGGIGSQNTGPKGVKADFEEAQRNQASIRMRQQIALSRQMEKKAVGNPVLTEAPKVEEKKKKKKSGSDSDDSDSDFDDDDDAFAKYKAERIKSVQDSLPSYSTYDRVSYDEFASMTKTVNPLCYIVCHFYQNHIPACAILNQAFEELAPMFPHVRFVRIRSNDAIANYDERGLPTIIVYKGGQMVHSFVQATNVISKPGTSKQVGQWLSGHDILRMPTGEDDFDKKRPTKKFAEPDDEDDLPISQLASSTLLDSAPLAAGSTPGTR